MVDVRRSTYILTCEREFVPLFVKVQDLLVCRELEKDAIKYIKVIPIKICPQSMEQRSLIRVEGLTDSAAVSFAVKVISLRNFEAPTVPSYCLNGVRTHELFKIAVNRPFGHIEFMCQIFAGVVPSKAQRL